MPSVYWMSKFALSSLCQHGVYFYAGLYGVTYFYTRLALVVTAAIYLDVLESGTFGICPELAEERLVANVRTGTHLMISFAFR